MSATIIPFPVKEQKRRRRRSSAYLDSPGAMKEVQRGDRKRGVWNYGNVPLGYLSLSAVTSDGELLMRIEVKLECYSAELVAQLQALLDQVDPVGPRLES